VPIPGNPWAGAGTDIAHGQDYLEQFDNSIFLKYRARRFVLLKLITNRHEASSGLFTTAELHVIRTSREQLGLYGNSVMVLSDP